MFNAFLEACSKKLYDKYLNTNVALIFDNSFARKRSSDNSLWKLYPIKRVPL